MAKISNVEFKPMVPFMPADPQYANAYVPYQINFKIVEPNEALAMGTIFPELYSPYKESGLLW